MTHQPSFIENIWYLAGWAEELAAGSTLARMVAGWPIVLFRGEDGVLAALEDRCSHRYTPLSEGSVEGGGIRCGYHGLLFGTDGRCLEMPGQKLASGFDIRRFAVAEQDGFFWLWLADPAVADLSLIPVTQLGQGGRACMFGALDYAAGYQLINDNLCDFSHVAFVHAATLAQGSDEWARRPPVLTNLPTASV